MATEIVPAPVSAEHTTTVTPTPGALYVAAARAEHFAHCTSCREIHAASEAAELENGESMQRRDRRQLGLNIVGPREVTR